MAKRGASSDLNQDNWNADDEPEKMGVFRKASPNELKMRSIKRAKRRGVAGTDEGPSIFKNFTAFGTKNTDSTAPSFSFLSEDNTPKLTNPSTFPSFSFGSLNNSSKKDSQTSDDPEKDNSFVKENTGTSLFNSDKPKFAFNSSNNKDDSDASVKSLTFNFGVNKGDTSAKPKKLPAFTSLKEEGTDTSVKSPPFKFGVNHTDSTVKSDILPAFNLNSSKDSATSTKSTSGETTFKFGIKSDGKLPDLSSSSKPFSLIENHSTAKSDTPDSKPSTFKLGHSKDSPKSTESNGIKATSENNTGKNKLFLANLKALNIGVLSWIKQHVDKNQYINLTPIFNDYKEHFVELKKKFDGSTTKIETASVAATVSEANIFQGSDPLSINSNTEIKPKPCSSSITSPLTSLKKTDSLPKFSGLVASPSSSSNEKVPEVKPFTFGIGGAKSLEKKETPDTTPSSSNKVQEVKPFTFGIGGSKSSDKKESSESNADSSAFSFGAKDKPSSAFTFGSNNSNSTFSFGANSNSSSSSTGFSFGASKDNKLPAFSFGTSTSNSPSSFSFKPNSDTSGAQSAESETKENNEAEDEVPKVEVSEVKESDALYEKKVKLFYKKGESYVDRGVGNLFLKPAGEKTQLVIRAYTNLGNILLNIILNESIPTQKVGKNNVLIVCVPNPPIDTSSASNPVSMLIRVKTEADCEELLSKIDEHKKK